MGGKERKDSHWGQESGEKPGVFQKLFVKAWEKKNHFDLNSFLFSHKNYYRQQWRKKIKNPGADNLMTICLLLPPCFHLPEPRLWLQRSLPGAPALRRARRRRPRGKQREEAGQRPAAPAARRPHQPQRCAPTAGSGGTGRRRRERPGGGRRTLTAGRPAGRGASG